ncbi:MULTISPECIES: hypothetical protein [unclassified Thiocapsa]|uniref:hypothetical protein n=1 Tax=unclassified Thiocapsa TaxID=2641286 RepID=UPI0035B105DD
MNKTGRFKSNLRVFLLIVFCFVGIGVSDWNHADRSSGDQRLVSPGQIDMPGSIPWSDLGNHVLSQGLLVLADTLNIDECPAHYADDSVTPDRVVLQWIAFTYYKWKEYDLASGKTCVVMEQPSEKILTLNETEILFSASRAGLSAMDTAVELDTRPVDPWDPTLCLPPIPQPIVTPSDLESDDDGKPHQGVSSPVNDSSNVELSWEDCTLAAETPETVIGTDDRQRVGSGATSYPWNTISYASFKQAGSGYRATAFLVSPWAALTNGHVVWDQASGSWSTDMVIYAGQYESGGSVVRPYGSRAAYQLATNTGYTGGSTDAQYDYATVRITSSFAGIGTFMPVVFSGWDIDNNTTTLNLAGYPGTAQGVSTLDQWFDADTSSSQTTTTVARYLMDSSGGNSGGPVWIFSGGNRYVVAIHCCGGTTTNAGPRLGSHNQALIESWVSWTPPDNYTLTVNSSGASNVPISANPSTYAGTTNYTKSNIASGTSIVLTAPGTAGSATFSSWSGCNSTSGTSCTVSMTSNKTITASYSDSDCSAQTALARQPDRSGMLDLLYQVRDTVLAASPDGQWLTDAYYKHSSEVSARLVAEPRLGLQALGVVRTLRPALEQAVAGRKPQLNVRESAAIRDFARALQRGASPELAADLEHFLSMDWGSLAR